MRVLIDNIAYSIQKIGGISLVFYELSSRLINDSRYKVEFIECEDADNNHYRRMLYIPREVIHKFSRRMMKFLRYIDPKPGIMEPYIFHSSYYRTSRDKNAINVTTVHDFTYEVSGKNNFATRVHIWQKKKAVMNSDIVVCISENTKRDLLHYYKGVDENRIFVVYNGVSDEYMPLDNIDEKGLPFKRGTYCIYVGVRRKYKNYNLAIDSLANTEYNIVLVGSPLSEDEKAYLDATIGANRYVCLSNVSNERLNQLYNGAFCLLYLSAYEGFGIPCVEAQKAGCPVIAYNASSIPEVICDKNLLCRQLSVGEVHKKMFLLTQHEYRKQVVTNGIEFAKQFSWDRCYRELTDLYDKALARK